MTYTDPEILYGKLTAGDVGRINAAADPITAAISALERAKTDLTRGTSTATASWRGTAADAFGARAELSGTAADRSRGRLEAAVGVVRAAANAYGAMRTAADEAIRPWRARPANLDEAGLRDLAERVNTALGGVRDGYESTLRGHARSLGELAPGFAEAAGDTAAWGQTAPQAGLTVPPPGSDPRAVAQWWAGLTETQRDQLLATEFDRLGQLRGLPAEVLDDANRRRIEVDRTRFEAERADLDARIAARAEELGIDPDDEGVLRVADDELADLLDQRQDVDRRLENANGAQSVLDRASREDIPGGVYVLSYDPVGPNSDGALAVAFGNPDTADHLGVVVPGTGTSVTSGFPVSDAANLRRQMDELGGGQNATIAWLGYDAPDSLLDLDVARADNARDGGETLVSDVDGYRAAAEAAGNHQHVTVIGHSYGSTTVGYAGLNGLAADDVAFIGSPGVGASEAGQLSPGEDHVWAGAAEHDPVVQATQGDHFTAGPSSTGVYDDGFGARIFGTPDGGGHLGAHSNYYDSGSESLRNLGNIATGHYDDVTDQRWQDDPLPAHPVLEGADAVTEVLGGVWDAGGEILHGDFGDAWDTARDTAGEVASDGVDVVVGTLGDVGEAGRDAYDNTIGRIPGL
ncbi:MAG TPA: alpha/beta hydrolase [Actinophytocola sp.]|uniref:alpha/beta hydrolase n=1 Tax=Actinophytocola sp. TaxID=1872138 RepID=UPI002DDD8BF0|nr:alpha/beta hydrolase [Actinophytocola sp.]HEV2783924.1 alpha/beta hydrolase [Actinophytocola sp.]